MFGQDPPGHLVNPGERGQMTTAWRENYRRLVRIYNEHDTLDVKNLLPTDHTDSKYIMKLGYRLFNANARTQWMTPARVAWITDTFDLIAPKKTEKHPELAELHKEQGENAYVTAIRQKKRAHLRAEQALEISRVISNAEEKGQLELFDSISAFLEECTQTLSSGSDPITGEALLLKDGDCVKSLIQAGSSGAMIHVTDIPWTQMETHDGKKGVLKCYKSLSSETKLLTGREILQAGRGYRPDETTSPQSHIHNVWASFDVMGALQWFLTHFKQLLLQKIRAGRYDYRLEKDGTFTVWYPLYAYWFFVENPDFHKFHQAKFRGGYIGNGLELLMKAGSHAQADAMSCHKIQILSKLRVANGDIHAHMSKLTRLDPSFYESEIRMNHASLQSNSSWIFLDRDFEKERSIPFDSDQLTITPAGVFSDEAKPAARAVKSDEAELTAPAFEAGLNALTFEAELPASALEAELLAPALEAESPASALEAKPPAREVKSDEAKPPARAFEAELPPLDESMDKRKNDYKRLKTAHEMGLKPINSFFHRK
jgi:hypothetical protein